MIQDEQQQFEGIFPVIWLGSQTREAGQRFQRHRCRMDVSRDAQGFASNSLRLGVVSQRERASTRVGEHARRLPATAQLGECFKASTEHNRCFLMLP